MHYSILQPHSYWDFWILLGTWSSPHTCHFKAEPQFRTDEMQAWSSIPASSPLRNFLLSLLHNIDVPEHCPPSPGSLPESLANMVCAEWTNTTGKKPRPLNHPVQLHRVKKKHMTFLLLPVTLCHLQILGAWKPYSLGACLCSLEDRFPGNSSFALSSVWAICLLSGIHVVPMKWEPLLEGTRIKLSVHTRNNFFFFSRGWG